MASALPPVKGTAFTFDLALVSQADTDIFKTSPTLAESDITVSKDGGDFANITTLPTQIQSTGVLPVALSATEMNADRVTVLFHDASGAEWQDAVVTIYTAAQSLDTTDGVADGIKTDTAAILADTGTDGVKIAATQGAITWGQQTISANVAAQGALHITNANAAGYGLFGTAPVAGLIGYATGATGSGIVCQGVTGGIYAVGGTYDIAGDITGNLSGSVGSVTDGSAIADDVWDEALSGHATAGTAGAALTAAGAATGTGSITFTYTLTDSADATAIEGATVEVYSDVTMSTLVASGTTNTSGQVVFYLDAGTYYLRRIKAGYSFTNPDTEVVA